jgi:hypothetical protein
MVRRLFARHLRAAPNNDRRSRLGRYTTATAEAAQKELGIHMESVEEKAEALAIKEAKEKEMMHQIELALELKPRTGPEYDRQFDLLFLNEAHVAAMINCNSAIQLLNRTTQNGIISCVLRLSKEHNSAGRFGAALHLSTAVAAIQGSDEGMKKQAQLASALALESLRMLPAARVHAKRAIEIGAGGKVYQRAYDRICGAITEEPVDGDGDILALQALAMNVQANNGALVVTPAGMESCSFDKVCELLCKRAVCNLKLGQFKDAFIDVNAALVFGLNDGMPHFIRIRMMLQLGFVAQARLAFDMATAYCKDFVTFEPERNIIEWIQKYNACGCLTGLENKIDYAVLGVSPAILNELPFVHVIRDAEIAKTMCAFCLDEGVLLKICPQCKSLWYCSTKCSKADWFAHAQECTAMIRHGLACHLSTVWTRMALRILGLLRHGRGFGIDGRGGQSTLYHLRGAGEWFYMQGENLTTALQTATDFRKSVPLPSTRNFLFEILGPFPDMFGKLVRNSIALPRACTSQQTGYGLYLNVVTRIAHSCKPNAQIRFVGKELFLVPIYEEFSPTIGYGELQVNYHMMCATPVHASRDVWSLQKFGISCTCEFCADPVKRAAFDELLQSTYNIIVVYDPLLAHASQAVRSAAATAYLKRSRNELERCAKAYGKHSLLVAVLWSLTARFAKEYPLKGGTAVAQDALAQASRILLVNHVHTEPMAYLANIVEQIKTDGHMSCHHG